LLTDSFKKEPNKMGCVGGEGYMTYMCYTRILFTHLVLLVIFSKKMSLCCYFFNVFFFVGEGAGAGVGWWGTGVLDNYECCQLFML